MFSLTQEFLKIFCYPRFFFNQRIISTHDHELLTKYADDVLLDLPYSCDPSFSANQNYITELSE